MHINVCTFFFNKKSFKILNFILIQNAKKYQTTRHLQKCPLNQNLAQNHGFFSEK